MGVALSEANGTRTSAPSFPSALTALLYSAPSTCTAFFPTTTQYHRPSAGLKVSATWTRLTALLEPKPKKEEGHDT